MKVVSRKTQNYIDDSKRCFTELVILLMQKENLTIDELSKELDRNRNYISAFISACVGLNICTIKVTNSKSVSLEKGLREKILKKLEEIIPQNLRNDSDAIIEYLVKIRKDLIHAKDLEINLTKPILDSLEVFLKEEGKTKILSSFLE